MKPIITAKAPGLTLKLETPPDNIYDKLQVAIAGGVA